MSAGRSTSRPVIDVYDLPESSLVFDARHPVWWGNALMMVAESTILTLLIVIYFYVQRNFSHWPPDRVDHDPPMLGVPPALFWGTLNTLLLLASCVPMIWADLQARRHIRAVAAARAEGSSATGTGHDVEDAENLPPPHMARLVVTILALGVIGFVAIGIRWLEFPALHFTADANAYGSITWTLLGAHILYLAMCAGEAILIGWWIAQEHGSPKRVLDVTILGSSWYWMVGVWLVIYFVVYWAPRLRGG